MHWAEYSGSIRLNRPKIQYSEDRMRSRRIFEIIKIDPCSPYKYLQNAKNPKEIGWEMTAKGGNVKLYILWDEHVSDQISGSRYTVTSITSWEQNFDISTTSHSILGGFFLFERDYFPPHFELFILKIGWYLVKELSKYCRYLDILPPWQ